MTAQLIQREESMQSGGSLGDESVTPLTLGHRIEDLSDVARYLNEIDFTLLKAKIITDKDEGLAPEWDSATADAVELRYKRYLYLLRKHEGQALPPSTDIDVFWHAHILDTQAYVRDCTAIFGYYLHHFPYFGIRGERDRQRLLDAGVVTRLRWQDEFGESLDKPVSAKRPAPKLDTPRCMAPTLDTARCYAGRKS